LETLIRAATIEDKESILELLNNVFMKQQRSSFKRGDNYYNWKFLDSPFGKSLLTVAEQDKRIIAVDTLWPWELNIRGEVHKVMQPCDSVVHPSSRGKGLFKKMRFYGIEMLKQSKPSFLFNFPNNQSITANISLGWTYLGKISCWIKILKPINVAKGFFYSSKSKPYELPAKY
jgi:hypothetical protein